MRESKLKIGKRYWIPSGYDKPIKRKLLNDNPFNERLFFRGRISRLPEEVHETKKECQDYINQALKS